MVEFIDVFALLVVIVRCLGFGGQSGEVEDRACYAIPGFLFEEAVVFFDVLD